ncbi:MAG: hypothetical protein PHN75_07490 [Syntrophales bacterium]|nr:hypothetical protein [Syntrophales bacterium]
MQTNGKRITALSAMITLMVRVSGCPKEVPLNIGAKRNKACHDCDLLKACGPE